MREPVGLRRQRTLAIVRARGTVRVRDLAAELGVSVVTARRDVEELSLEGRVVRGHGVVSSVEPAPSAPAAAAEAPGADETVALLVPARHTYLYETLQGARGVLEEAGARVTLHLSGHGEERATVDRALADGARGLLIAPKWRGAADEEADYAWLSTVQVPTVLMERRPRPGSAPHALDSVSSDHWYGVHLAVDHLTRFGHRRLVLAARDDSPTARAVRAAFAEIAAARPEVTDWAVALSTPEAGPDLPAGRLGEPLDLAELLARHRATAAVRHGDVDALVLVQQLNDRGVRVPQDCSVVAYDDVVAGLGNPPLTAVSPPKAEIGAAAAELLLRRLRRPAGTAPEPVRRVELLPELKVRGSAQRVSEPTD